MSTSTEALPRIVPPDGAPVTGAAPIIDGPPFQLRLPPDRFDPEALDNRLLTFLIAEGAEILEATASLAGKVHPANLASGASPSGGGVLIDLGGLRPVSRIDFTRGNLDTSNKLMIQLGGVWHVPPPAGAVMSFDSYPPNTPFPELITEKVLIANVGIVRAVESITFPSNLTLRLTDGGVPFFFHRGSLRSDGARVPDFGQQLDLAARGAEAVNGVRAIDLIVHSDTFGTVLAEQARIAGRAVHNSLAGLAFEARTVSVPSGGTSHLNLPVPDGLVLPEGRPAVAAVRLGLVALGFGPAFAPTVVHHGAVVSAGFAVAQAVDIDAPRRISTLYLYLLRRTPKATVTVELREDSDGEPRGVVLGAATVDAAGLTDGAFGWLPATFPAPPLVESGTRLWIVPRADAGEVEWGGDDVPTGGLAARFSADRGNTWQPHPMTAAYLIVQDFPDPNVPLTLRLTAGGHQQAAPYDPSAFPLALDAASPLVDGINAAIKAATGGVPGTPLPPAIDLAVSADPPLPLQLTLTQFDVTYVQTRATDSTLSGDPGDLRLRTASDGDDRKFDAEVPDALPGQSDLSDAVQAGR